MKDSNYYLMLAILCCVLLGPTIIILIMAIFTMLS